jgi:hypothetical protein
VVEAWLSSMKQVVRTVFADDDRQHSNPVWVAILWMQVLPMQDRQVDLDESSAPTTKGIRQSRCFRPTTVWGAELVLRRIAARAVSYGWLFGLLPVQLRIVGDRPG